ncbi:hypothetical protein HY212_05360 [Candidatus Pacearchaeota archaeon]|nr:hypothetical protein [Candidatus Pacearchaeota archaeon]
MARIKRFDVLRMASFMGIYGLFIGLIAALLMGMIISALMTYVSGGLGGTSSSSSFNWLNLVLFPIIYGVIGFISGLILTPIINLILKIIGGIGLDIDFDDYPQEIHQAYQPPQPPGQYSQQSRY